MAIRQILHYPDSRLRLKALPVTDINGEIKTLIADMFETMYSLNGIGLAATQINVQKRVIVMHYPEQGINNLCLINPELITRDGKVQSEEGCLSVPGIYENVTRAKHITMRALDRDGKPFEMESDAFFAICIQHEIDHLDGKVFVDYLSPLKRERIQKKLSKYHRETL